ncbi:hypothetical protein RclHR1_03860014 [Rhizophagus clarus]|nr:hypothetical protein RclHR1_03860014 [Rhizophagus clarus]
MDFRSARNLKAKMEKGGNTVPPFFIWFLQDYPETAAYFLRRLNPILLNFVYDKISGYLLDYAADLLLPGWIFPKDWMKGYQPFLESVD